MKRLMWLILAAQVLGGAASAQTLHPLPSRGLAWKAMPSANDITRYYPDKAQRAGLSGWAVIECLTETTGDLKSCQLLGEAPAGADFGAAALRLSRLFKLDVSKVAPETLSGGVVTIPIVLTLDGKPRGLRNDLAGGPSVLLTPSAKGATPCPTAAAPSQTCEPHRFEWAERPTITESAPFVRGAAGSPTLTAVICPIGADMKLSHCIQAGSADPTQVAAMNQLLPLFTAPPQAEDKALARDGFVLVQFDWPALKRAVETSVLTRP
jgi:hypothetical protein